MWRKFALIALLLIAASFSFGMPASAQSGTVWSGEYYSNGNLEGNPALRRTDNQIAFNWGTGSPDIAIPADAFSVRWATDVTLAAGTYRFYAQADDNIRVTFNFGFNPVIDTFTNTAQVSQLVTGDVTVPANGTYHIQVDYRELSSAAFAYVTYANLATNPNFPGFAITAPPTSSAPITSGVWTAQYYANASLQGDPSAIFTEGTVTHNWGNGSPVVNIPPDNFSARWSSAQNLTGGAYTLNVRADDGVRVYINGVLTIDEFRPASGLTYTRSLTLPTGANTFIVEYYEASGDAFIEFSLSGAGTIIATTPPIVASEATATVTAFRLNVRNSPNATTGAIVTRINRFEQYPITGRTADSLWVQLNVRGTQGWVSTRYVNIAPLGVNIPVIGSTTPSATAAPSGNFVTATPYNVVIRRGPGTSFGRIGLLPVGGTGLVIGRNGGNTWWQVNYNGLIGWVSADFAGINAGANIGTIPVTG